MADKNLNELLKWSIENQAANPDDETKAAAAAAPSKIDPELFAALFGGGPSDADLMKASMDAITSSDPEITPDDRLVAFDNFEQLVENLDNANNIANLGLWTPLLDCLAHEETGVRRMAAWCIGTAVQNNAKSQEKMFAMGGVPTLVDLALKEGEDVAVRRKAVYALSSACRNYQPALDLCLAELEKRGISHEKVDAEDMNAVDAVITPLKEAIK